MARSRFYTSEVSLRSDIRVGHDPRRYRQGKGADGAEGPAAVCVGRRLATRPLGCVAHAYRNVLSDLRSDSRLAPTFADALARHRMLEEIERAAAG